MKNDKFTSQEKGEAFGVGGERNEGKRDESEERRGDERTTTQR